MAFYITKYSGEKELFNIHKFRRSLKRAGASPAIIEELMQELQKNPSIRSTHDIYAFAFNRLKEHSPALAARYNVKKALFELGPTGFPFERFVALIFKGQGYQTETDQLVQGKCVEHEIDIVANKKKRTFMIECKFHNQQGIKSDVKVPLYVKARFEDIQQHTDSRARLFHEAWLVSNTNFTTQAIEYAQCAQINLLSFSYPEKNNLAELIDRLGLHPITALASLTTDQKKELISQGLVLCKDVPYHTGLLKKIGISSQKVLQITQQAQAVCQFDKKQTKKI